jgi:hypothetical protein
MKMLLIQLESMANSIQIKLFTRMNNMRIMINERMMMIEEAGRPRKRLSIRNVA